MQGAALATAYGTPAWTQEMRPTLEGLMDSSLAHVDVVSPTATSGTA